MTTTLMMKMIISITSNRDSTVVMAMKTTVMIMMKSFKIFAHIGLITSTERKTEEREREREARKPNNKTKQNKTKSMNGRETFGIDAA